MASDFGAAAVGFFIFLKAAQKIFLRFRPFDIGAHLIFDGLVESRWPNNE